MFLVELVVQGVRGIRELARLRFQSGFNFVAAGNESGKTSSIDAILRLLYPSDNAGAMDQLISRYTPDASRAALVAFSDDGSYYRIIQDFSRRGVNLSKYNAAKKDFGLIYKDWQSTVEFMQGLTSGIPEGEFSRLFILRRDHGAPKSAPAPAAAARIRAIPAAAPAARRTTEQQARLAELREALQKSEEAADADYRAQSARLRLEELKKKLEQLEELDGRSSDLQANLEQLKGCEGLPENIKELLDTHEQSQGQKMAKSDELNRDIEDLKMQIEMTPHVNLFTDKIFILGALVAVLSVLAGIFVLTPEQAPFFPLGVLLALVLMAIAWYKGSIKNTARKTLMKEVDGLQAELQELEKSFEQGGEQIQVCMKATDSTTAAELKDKAENYHYFAMLLQEIEEQKRRLLGAQTVEDLVGEFQTLQQEVVELERASAALSQYAVDTYAIRQDIERLEAEMNDGAPDPGSTVPYFAEETGFAAPPFPAGQPNGFLADLETASRIGGIEMETLVPAVAAAVQRNFTAVTAGRYLRVDIGHEGDPVIHAKDDSVVNFAELSHGTKDALYFCFRAGLVEALVGKRKLPLILDDPLAGFDPLRQQAACQILRGLGSKTQVILFSSNPALKTAGDAAAELK